MVSQSFLTWGKESANQSTNQKNQSNQRTKVTKSNWDTLN